jgi:hypothetical protein
MSKRGEATDELLFPPFVVLLKITSMLIEKGNVENISFTTDELKEAVKKVVIEYCRGAWSEGRMPLYTFKSRWESPELERDIQILFNDFILPPSKIDLTERGKYFLKHYEDRRILSQYEEKLKKAINKVYQRKEMT